MREAAFLLMSYSPRLDQSFVCRLVAVIMLPRSRVQVVVHGIPYQYDWRDLKDMFNSDFAVDRADIAIGQDGRSKVGGVTYTITRYIQRQVYRSPTTCHFHVN